ncbi:MAG: TerB family tellurite resistance protein [Polyangiales bacterium]
MLFRWLRGDTGAVDAPKAASEELTQLVRASLPDASVEAAAIIGAVAGLLAFVAYADRDYHDDERRTVRDALGRIDGLPSHAGEPISDLLASRIGELAHEPLQTYTRVLYEHTSREARLEVLDVLMDVAIADDVLSMDETNDLRRIARQLGLSDRDYDAVQARHRERLSVLR